MQKKPIRKSKIKVAAAIGARKAPPVPRKNNKKTTKPELAADTMDITINSTTETEKPAEVVKPKAKAAPKKAPAKKKQVVTEDEEDEVMALKDRLATYNLDSSPESSAAMDTAPAPPQGQKKATTKRAVAAKKPAKTVEPLSDDDAYADEDFSVAAKPTQAVGKKRQPAKKQMVGQKLVTDMLKPAAVESPEKKVRKMRASPFNKKSGSFTINSIEEEEVNESEPAITRARPQRGNGRPTTYVVSESEDDNDSDASEDEDDSDDE